jgi:Flp pilus assembly pilin Flp
MTTQTKALVPANNVSKPRTLLGLIRDQRGAGMTEYIILVGVIALLAIAAFKVFGTSISTKVGEQSTAVDGIGK